MKSRRRAAPALTLIGMTLIGFPTAVLSQESATVPSSRPAGQAEGVRASDILQDDYAQDTRVIDALTRSKAALDRREHDLDQRAARIAAAEQLARREIGQLSSLRNEVQKLVDQQTQEATADLDKLAILFTNMKPVQAAAILGKLEIPKAAAIMRRLDTRMAGPVLAAMEPAAAAGVTVELQRAHAAFQN